MGSVLLDDGEIVHIASSIVINDNLSLIKFVNAFLCLPAPLRPNTSNCFQLVDISQPPFQNSLSLLKPTTRAELLSNYPGSIQIYFPMILCFGIQLGYEGPNTFILSKNLASALADTEIIDKKLAEDLRCRRVKKVTNLISLFISSLLGFVPKYNGGWRKIHHLSHLVSRSVNNHIPNGVGEIRYIRF